MAGSKYRWVRGEAPPPSDRELVDAVLADDRDVIDYLFYTVVSSVCLPIVRRFGIPGGLSPEELSSEIYMLLSADDWAKLREFRFDASLKTWLWAVALRILLDRNSKLTQEYAQRCREHMIDLSTTIDLPDERDSEAAHAERVSDNIQLLRTALRKMDNHNYRSVIQLRGIQRLSSKETASILGKTATHVDQLFARAKKKLKLMIEESYQRKGTS